MHHSCFSPTGSTETRNGIAAGQEHAAGRLLCREPAMLQVGGEGGITNPSLRSPEGGRPPYGRLLPSTASKLLPPGLDCGGTFPPQKKTPLWVRIPHDGFASLRSVGGEGGIRTHGGQTPTTVFETVSFGHSDTSPLSILNHRRSPAKGGRILLP